MNNQPIEELRKLPLLKDADPQVLVKLAGASREREFEEGQVILREGASGQELYVVIDGEVEVVKQYGGHEVVLARRGRGELFGEMSLIEDSPRFATIRALTPARLLEISEPDLRSILARQPILLYEVARVLSSRLRATDLKMIADLQRKNRELAQAYEKLKAAQAALLEKERLDHEMDLARDLQQSILPQVFPNLPGVSFAARSQPARHVGGDFYDVFLLDGGQVGLLMADVADKGLSAALYMALTRSLIRAEAGHHTSPRQVLMSTNELLLAMTQGDMFVTVFYGILDVKRRELSYARAGHDYPLLVRRQADACQRLAGRGMALGCVNGVRLEEITTHLQPGDLLVLYTDGITDANSTAGAFFGPARLRKLICASRELGAQEVCDVVFENVASFQAGAVQYDDMALLTVRIAESI